MPLLEAMSWRWLRTRILGLLSAVPTYVPHGDGKTFLIVQSTRIGFQLDPPPASTNGG